MNGPITGSTDTPFPYIIYGEGAIEGIKTVSDSASAAPVNLDGIPIVTGSYPYVSFISSEFHTASYNFVPGRNLTSSLNALQTTLDYYKILSPHYAYSSSLGSKIEQDLRLISIPSIFYGQSIRKGSLELKFYITGAVIGELRDVKKNGELIQVGPAGSNNNGNVAGVVLYNEGFILLTGSWDLSDTHTETYDGSSRRPSWKYFMDVTGSSGLLVSSSWSMEFEGTETIPVMTMFAKAEKGEFNHSNNQTYIEYGQQTTPISSSNTYKERDNLTIKNIVHSEYDEEDPPFEKITYISKVALYDEEKNLIGVAKMAKPVRKRQNDNIAFKLKLDI